MSNHKTIPYGRQCIDNDDIRAVVDVLHSEWLTQGNVVPYFESYVARYCSAKFAVAANSATSALHLACLALGLGPGDLLWTSSVTFVASANCGRYCGADVDFVDVDPESGNMSPDALEVKLRHASKLGRLPKIVIPVHLCGEPCDMLSIRALSEQYGFKIIEDASHAIGARYRGEPVGNGHYSDITVFSFHPVKVITSAEGGMAVTNDAALDDRMRLLRSHGITRDASKMVHTSPPAWYYEQLELGFNYRMSDVHAALGLSQAKKLDRFVSYRNEVAKIYDDAFAALPVKIRQPLNLSSRHLYVIQVDSEARDAIFNNMRSAGIGVNVHYYPVHLQNYYRKLGFCEGHCPNAEAYSRAIISLPIYVGITREEIHYVTEVVNAEVQKSIVENA